MSDHQEEFTIGAMSRVLRVTRQGYYAWLQRDPSDRALEDAVLRVEIRAIHKKSRRSYGSRRVRLVPGAPSTPQVLQCPQLRPKQAPETPNSSQEGNILLPV